MSIVIAVDGPAASGKGTISRRLAQHFHFRAQWIPARFTASPPGRCWKRVAIPPRDRWRLSGAATIDLSRAAALPSAPPRSAPPPAVSAIPSVRAALHDFQINFITHPPGESWGAVMDGRDIGTVIAPTPPQTVHRGPAGSARPTAAGWNFPPWASLATRRSCWRKSWAGTRPTAAAPSPPCGGRRTPPCSIPPIWI